MATRRQELDILDSVYHLSDGDFKPFYDKANKLTNGSGSRFIATLIKEYQNSLTAYAHIHTSPVRDEQVEAVHGGIIAHETYASGDEPMVLVDGDREKARHLTKACSGLRSEIPPIAHCAKAELYYPTSLLADLTANYLANLIEQGDYNYESPVLRVRFADRQRSRQWGRAYSAFYNNDIDYHRSVSQLFAARRLESESVVGLMAP